MNKNEAKTNFSLETMQVKRQQSNIFEEPGRKNQNKIKTLHLEFYTSEISVQKQI